jgi:hypothetical protein
MSVLAASISLASTSIPVTEPLGPTLTQEAKPTETATANVERPQALAAPQTIEQCTPGRLPHAGLELEAFEFRNLTGQKIG